MAEVELGKSRHSAIADQDDHSQKSRCLATTASHALVGALRRAAGIVSRADPVTVAGSRIAGVSDVCACWRRSLAPVKLYQARRIGAPPLATTAAIQAAYRLRTPVISLTPGCSPHQ